MSAVLQMPHMQKISNSDSLVRLGLSKVRKPNWTKSWRECSIPEVKDWRGVDLIEI